MKVIIDEELYEGTAVEILDKLKERKFDLDDCPDTESYICFLQNNVIRMTDRACDLPDGSTERRAAVMIDRLESIGALRKLVA